MNNTKNISQQALHHRHFILHLLRNCLIGLVVILFALLIGMLGYHYFEKMEWADAFVNAAMILSGMGPMGNLSSTGGKIFAGFYALFSGLIFIMIVGLIFAPVVHRFFKRVHLEASAESKK